jgi:acyl-CoA synthetase (AMP-forming)/AMP-acid ligase II
MAGIGHWARAAPDATALLHGRRSLRFGELDDRSRRVAGALASGGIRRGDRIAVLAANRVEFVEIVSAALRAGVVPVPVNPLLAPREVEYVVEDSGARWLFCDRTVELIGIQRVVTFGDAYERLLHESEPARIEDVVLGRPMHYTSGTTGAPKGVWVDPQPPGRAARLSEGFRSLWDLHPDDVHLVCSPLTHSAPLRFSIRTLEAGGTVALQAKFDPAETLATIELFGVASTFAVPTHLERIIQMGDRALMRHDLSSMRLLAHAGAPIRAETKRAVIELFPKGSVWEFYGSTEGQATRISTEEWLRKPGSVGQALPGAEVVVTTGDGGRLPPGEVGEIWIRDANAERFSYWGDEGKTAAAWRDDAFSVGDLGWVDDDGYLFLTGRKHDTIISGGVNVYPQEVEGVLLAHPAVLEAMVFGTPHDEWGQQVVARVVPAPGAPVDPERLRAWARERLAGYKCPRRIELVPSLPRTPTGKIKRPPAL